MATRARRMLLCTHSPKRLARVSNPLPPQVATHPLVSTAARKLGRNKSTCELQCLHSLAVSTYTGGVYINQRRLRTRLTVTTMTT